MILFSDQDRKEHIYQIMTVGSVSQAVLIIYYKDITLVLGFCNWTHCLLESVIIYYHPPRYVWFLRGQTFEINVDIMITYSSFFRSLG